MFSQKNKIINHTKQMLNMDDVCFNGWLEVMQESDIIKNKLKNIFDLLLKFNAQTIKKAYSKADFAEMLEQDNPQEWLKNNQELSEEAKIELLNLLEREQNFEVKQTKSISKKFTDETQRIIIESLNNIDNKDNLIQFINNLDIASDAKNTLYSLFDEVSKPIITENIVIDSKYYIKRNISYGATGEVWEAFDTSSLNSVLAIKFLHNLPHLIDAAVNEKNHLDKLSHINIVRCKDLNKNSVYPYIVYEYIEGTHLDQYINQQHLSLVQKLDIVSEVLKTLEYIHSKNILHLDIKPDNILINKDKITLCDFGNSVDMLKVTAKSFDNVGVHQLYSSPELRNVEVNNIKYSSDIFSVGKVLQQICVHDNITSALQKIISKATDENHALRYQSCQAFLIDLQRFSASLGKKSKKTMITIISLVSLIGLLTTGFSIYKFSTANSHIIIDDNHKNTAKPDANVDKTNTIATPKKTITITQDEEILYNKIESQAYCDEFNNKEITIPITFVSIFGSQYTSIYEMYGVNLSSAKNKKLFINHRNAKYLSARNEFGSSDLMISIPLIVEVDKYPELEKKVLSYTRGDVLKVKIRVEPFKPKMATGIKMCNLLTVLDMERVNN